MKRKEEASIDRKTLVKVAKEINSLMFEEGEGIDITADDTDIIDGLKEAAAELTPKDKISELATTVLTSIGALESDDDEPEADPAPKKTNKKAEVKEDDEPEVEPEAEPEVDDDEPEVEPVEDTSEFTLEQKVNATSKLAVLKELVKENDELKKLRKTLDKYQGLAGPRELKAEICKILGIEVKKAASGPKKEKKERKENKAMYFVRVWTCENPEITIDEIIEKLKKKDFTANKSSIHIRRNEMRHAMTILKELGKIK